jgi:hypothetical protein
VTIDPAYTGVISIENQASMSVAPVPSKGFLAVTLNDVSGVKPFEILDLQGRVVMQGEMHKGRNVLDISNFQHGFYHLKVNTDNGILISKIMKI